MTDNPELKRMPEAVLPAERQIPPAELVEIGHVATGPFVEADPDEDISWINPPVRTPEEEKAINCADAYLFGRIGPEDGITPDDVETWFATLSPEEQAERDKGAQDYQDMLQRSHEVEVKLKADYPELLGGRLPGKLADRIGNKYILGTNQSYCDDLEQALAYLEDLGGIQVVNSSLAQRFQFFRQDTNRDFISHSLTDGWRGKEGGVRFVVAVPGDISEESVSLVPDRLSDSGQLPEDFRTPGKPQDDYKNSVVNPKYIAGIVDMNGVFTPNTHFMQEPSFVPQEMAPSSSSV